MDRIITATSESVKRHEKFVHFYCVKCRDHFKSNEYEDVVFKNGKKALKCKCTKCETSSYLITKSVA